METSNRTSQSLVLSNSLSQLMRRHPLFFFYLMASALFLWLKVIWSNRREYGMIVTVKSSLQHEFGQQAWNNRKEQWLRGRSSCWR